MNQILDCKIVRDTRLAEIKKQVALCKTTPSMAVVQVGDREDSTKYVNNKIARCVECGIKGEVLKLKDSITTEELIDTIVEVQSRVSAIIVQCPLPKHIDEKRVMEVIDPLKDCDGLTTENIGLLHNQQPRIIPATAQGILDLIDYHNIDVEGMDILLIGRSNLVNRPLYEALLQRNATPMIAHSKTLDLKHKLASGDFEMVIGAIGKSEFLSNVNTKYIIDVGINVDEQGKLHGDFNMDTSVCEYYTKVPGGCGLLTQAGIVGNILKCHMLQHEA